MLSSSVNLFLKRVFVSRCPAEMMESKFKFSNLYIDVSPNLYIDVSPNLYIDVSPNLEMQAMPSRDIHYLYIITAAIFGSSTLQPFLAAVH